MVGHDHGGAVAQLLTAEHPERIDRLVIADAEAYDNWPSRQERPFVRATQLPPLGDALLWARSRRPLFRLTMARGNAVCDRSVLTPELLDAYIRANLSDRDRRAKTRRFLAGQLDPTHNQTRLELLDGLRRFDHPTLLLWATDDPTFGPEWGKRLQADIPGVVRLELVHGAGHLLMEERPDQARAAGARPPRCCSPKEQPSRDTPGARPKQSPCHGRRRLPLVPGRQAPCRWLCPMSR